MTERELRKGARIVVITAGANRRPGRLGSEIRSPHVACVGPGTAESECLCHIDSGGFHLFHRSLCVSGIEVDATASVEHDVRSKSKAQRIQRRELHTIVRGEAQNVDRADPVLAKIACQACVFGAAVIKEAAVAVDFPINTFLENSRPLISV